MARIDAAQNILDCGCGTGLLLEHLRDRFPDAALTGLDASPDMLAIACKRLPEATLIEADLAKPNIKGQFDLVLSVNVLHHLNDPQGHIASLQQFCAANGTVMLCDLSIDTLSLQLAERYWRLSLPSHHQAFSQNALKNMLSPYFDVVDSAILKPDWFWQLQIYKLRRKA